MKEQKKHTQKQLIAKLDKQVQQMFGLLVQLGQEVQMIGGMSQTTLQVLKEMDGYDKAVEAFKKKEEEVAKEEPTEETDELILE